MTSGPRPTRRPLGPGASSAGSAFRLARVASADGVVIHPLDAAGARAAGQLCAATATADVVNASVVLLARLVDGVTLTSDSGDLRRIDPTIDLVDC